MGIIETCLKERWSSNRVTIRLRVHVPSMSPFFVLFRNGFNAGLWDCLHMMSKRSKVPLTQMVTLTLRVNKPYEGGFTEFEEFSIYLNQNLLSVSGMTTFQINSKQECIPAGCAPPAR